MQRILKFNEFISFGLVEKILLESMMVRNDYVLEVPLTDENKELIKGVIEQILLKYPNKIYKIGKTFSCEERAKNKDYSDENYTDIFPIYKNSNKSVIDELEAELIHQHMDNELCANKQKGSGTMADSSEYELYVAIKN